MVRNLFSADKIIHLFPNFVVDRQGGNAGILAGDYNAHSFDKCSNKHRLKLFIGKNDLVHIRSYNNL